MNEKNFATLEASKKLVDNGIVLETDMVWSDIPVEDHWHIRPRLLCGSKMVINEHTIPSPCFTDVWRELPHEVSINTMLSSKMMWTFDKGKLTEIGYWWHEEVNVSKISDNPTDAAIDLLLWLEGRRF